MNKIAFYYGSIEIYIFQETAKTFMYEIIDAVRERRSLENPHLFMEMDQIELFNKIFKDACALPISREILKVWSSYGPEDSNEPLKIWVTSVEALERRLYPYEICRFSK